MNSIDDWFAASDKLKEQILFAFSSLSIPTSSNRIAYKTCPLNLQLSFALIKGSSRSKKKSLKICYRTEMPSDISTKCFKPVFVVPHMDTDLSLGNDLIDYSWVSVNHSKFTNERLFLTLTTNTHNIVYEIPDPLITAESHLSIQTCSLVHYQSHAKEITKTDMCDISFGFSYTQPVFPQLDLSLNFPWNEQFLHNRDRLEVGNEMISKALPLGKVHKDFFDTYYRNMIKTATGKSWLHDDESTDYGDFFMISIFTNNDDKSCIQFYDMCVTTDKAKATKIFEKFKSNVDDLFVFDFWSYISSSHRLSASVKLAQHDMSVLRLSISRIEDAWSSVINHKPYPEESNVFSCLCDFLIYGAIDEFKVTFLDDCFTPKNLKKIVTSIKAVYENAKKVTLLLSSLELLRNNVQYFVALLESKKEFSLLIEDELVKDCNTLLNTLEGFNTIFLFESLPKETKSHETFITWITDLSKKHFKVGNINTTDFSTDQVIYKHLKSYEKTYFNISNDKQKYYGNTENISSFVTAVEEMGLQNMIITDETVLSGKLTTLMCDYLV